MKAIKKKQSQITVSRYTFSSKGPTQTAYKVIQVRIEYRKTLRQIIFLIGIDTFRGKPSIDTNDTPGTECLSVLMLAH